MHCNAEICIATGMHLGDNDPERGSLGDANNVERECSVECIVHYWNTRSPRLHFIVRIRHIGPAVCMCVCGGGGPG